MGSKELVIWAFQFRVCFEFRIIMKRENKEIKANLEYVRKLFIMPDSPDKFIAFD